MRGCTQVFNISKLMTVHIQVLPLNYESKCIVIRVMSYRREAVFLCLKSAYQLKIAQLLPSIWR